MPPLGINFPATSALRSLCCRSIVIPKLPAPSFRICRAPQPVTSTGFLPVAAFPVTSKHPADCKLPPGRADICSPQRTAFRQVPAEATLTLGLLLARSHLQWPLHSLTAAAMQFVNARLSAAQCPAANHLRLNHFIALSAALLTAGNALNAFVNGRPFAYLTPCAR